MRFLTRSVLPLALLLIGTASAGAEPPPPEEPPPYAVRVEGYLGATILDAGDLGDEEAFNGGGAASVVGKWGLAALQVDVYGDFADFNPDANNVGFGGHLGIWRPDYGGLALTGGFQQQEVDLGLFDAEDEFFRVGGEAEMYFGMWTVGAHGGYFENDETGDGGWYTRGLLRFYPTEDLKLELVGGYAEQENDSLPLGRFLVEFRPAGSWLGYFARWEGTFDDDVFGGSRDQHAAVVGFRFYWDSGVSLRETDRSYFRDACTNLHLLSRLC